MRKRGDDEETVLDADSGEELVPEETETSVDALKQKLKSLREELRTCASDRDQNLEGWQRSKADLVNYRRMVEGDLSRAAARGKEELLGDVLPALDSFESATQSSEWSSVDESWRTGVERIKDQLTGALTRGGVTSYGEAHEAFDPVRHECMSVTPTPDAAADHMIAQVLQKGYMLGEVVVRPAKVIVFQYTDPPAGEST